MPPRNAACTFLHLGISPSEFPLVCFSDSRLQIVDGIWLLCVSINDADRFPLLKYTALPIMMLLLLVLLLLGKTIILLTLCQCPNIHQITRKIVRIQDECSIILVFIECLITQGPKQLVGHRNSISLSLSLFYYITRNSNNHENDVSCFRWCFSIVLLESNKLSFLATLSLQHLFSSYYVTLSLSICLPSNSN